MTSRRRTSPQSPSEPTFKAGSCNSCLFVEAGFDGAGRPSLALGPGLTVDVNCGQAGRAAALSRVERTSRVKSQPTSSA